MNWLKKLLARFRTTPRIVIECRRNEDGNGVNLKLAAVHDGFAEEYELKMLAVILLALEKGAFQMSREDDNPSMGKLCTSACELGCVLLAKVRGII